MASQNFFYISVSSAIIIIAIFCVAIAIIAIIIGFRILKFSRNLQKASGKINEIVENLREKTKFSSFIVLATQGLKELVKFIKEKRKKKS